MGAREARGAAVMVAPEALHPGPVVQKTAKKRRRAVKAGEPSGDGFTELYTWFAANGRSLETAPDALVGAAREYVKERIRLLIALSDEASRAGTRTERIRTQLKWLRRWAKLLRSKP